MFELNISLDFFCDENGATENINSEKQTDWKPD